MDDDEFDRVFGVKRVELSPLLAQLADALKHFEATSYDPAKGYTFADDAVTPLLESLRAIQGELKALRKDVQSLKRHLAEDDDDDDCDPLEELLNATQFVLDYARDLGQCAICDGGIGRSDEPVESECMADCPGRNIRRVLAKLKAKP